MHHDDRTLHIVKKWNIVVDEDLEGCSKCLCAFGSQLRLVKSENTKMEKFKNQKVKNGQFVLVHKICNLNWSLPGAPSSISWLQELRSTQEPVGEGRVCEAREMLQWR